MLRKKKEQGSFSAAFTPLTDGFQLETASQIHDYEQKLRRLSSELSLAEARERREIASDLHDHLGQALAYVAMKISRLQGNSVFCGFEEDFSEILSLLDKAIRYTRDLTVEISPPVLYELGLAPAIDWLAEQIQRRHGLSVTTTQVGVPIELAEDIKISLFKSIQELITNVIKHAHAGSVAIETGWRQQGVTIHVTDNGQGFTTSKLTNGAELSDGFGLFSIRERLSYIGGAMEIHSVPGEGTRVMISAPNRI